MTSNPNIGQEQALRERVARELCRQDGFDPDGAAKRGYGWRNYADRADQIIAIIAPTPAQVEPDAWFYEIPGSGVWRLYRTRYISHQAVAEGWTETPLYAHPPAAGDSEAGRLREALTQIFDATKYVTNEYAKEANRIATAALAGSEGGR